MTRSVRVVSLALTLAAIAMPAGCGSDEDGVTSASPTSASAATSSTTAAAAPAVTGGPDSPEDSTAAASTPPPGVEFVAGWEEIDAALPDLVATTTEALHVIELRLRTIEVLVAQGQVCLSGGEVAPGPDNCAPLADGPGLLVYSDNSPITRVYAILTAAGVTVEFESMGPSLSCFSEPATRVGPMVLWWCEDQFAPTIRFVTPDGRILQVSIG